MHNQNPSEISEILTLQDQVSSIVIEGARTNFSFFKCILKNLKQKKKQSSCSFKNTKLSSITSLLLKDNFCLNDRVFFLLQLCLLFSWF